MTRKYDQIIQSSPLFTGMGENALDEAFRLLHAREKSVKKGEFIYHLGDAVNHFGLLLEGSLRVCMDDIDGNRMLMAEVTPGKTFAESMCLLKVRASKVYVYAAEPSVLLWMTADELFTGQGSRAENDLQRRFAAMLAGRTLEMNRRIQVLSKLRLRDKLVTYFSNKVKESGSLSFTVPLNREDLAIYMGVNRSALSRELSAMKAEGLIDYRGNVFRVIKEENNS